MPVFSVVIPIFNRGAYISRALQSILNQSFQDFEIIIVDGGSTDNGLKVISEYKDPRITLVVQDGKGVSGARNQGVSRAKGELIAFLDADDEWMPGHLETIIRLYNRYPEAGMFNTAFKKCLPGGKIIWNGYAELHEPPWEGIVPNYFKSGALGDTPFWTSVSVIPKKIFLEVGGFPTGYWYGEDHDLFGKIALRYPVAFSWELGALYHMDAENRTTDRAYNKGFPVDDEEPFVKTARLAIKSGIVKPEHIVPLNEYIAKKEIWRAAQNVQIGRGKAAREILKHCTTRWNYMMKVKWTAISMLPFPLFVYIKHIKYNIF